MKTSSTTTLSERCMWGALIFCTLYESYRYPFKINSTITSPTYSDTPASLQVAKFIIASLFCMVAAGYVPRRLLTFRNWAFAVLVGCLSSYAMFKAVVAESGNTAYINAAFWPVAALVLALCIRSIRVGALDRYFKFLFFLGLASTAVELFLFVAFGRLPALAYNASIAVRFGAFLDDPNGFAAIWYLLMGWTYYRFSGGKRILIEAALVFCLLLTQSLTAFVFLLLLGIWMFARYMIKNPRPLLIAGVAVFCGAAAATVWSVASGIVAAILEVRSGSVSDHLSQFTTARASMGLGWVFGTPAYTPYESWWVGSLVNFGVPWYLLNFAVVATLLVATSRAFRRARSVQRRAVFGGILLFSIYFVVANLNLPLFLVFPVNFLFFFLTFLVYFDKLRPEQAQGEEVPE